ncbi:MAG TPA: metal ABC transporter permease [Candidatus Odoribacter faecigallinarum]|uniref:Metal ABC transporter permease n=1 Tax=Candidatus Odoribacter faecigallinarum TaxID=2838706 RepID=A0A9D2ABV6_9BACT|nr:metal ABC transporter permease [Candidatus Odoribacter faecigallinarum]
MFELLKYDFFLNALISTLLIGISCGLVGTYIVAKRMVFISGGITHASFGGLGIAYYLGMPPMAGATVFALAAALGILFWGDSKKLRKDSLIGIFWSAGMAIGVLFIYLTPGYAPNLMSYLFGNILTVTGGQVLLSGILCLLVLLFFAGFYRPLFYIAFDKEYSRTHHIHTNTIETAITIIIALSIVLCMKLAGIILVISYLTIPQSIAGLFYKNFTQLLVASSMVSTLGSMAGLFISAELETPTGATIVVCFLLLFLLCWSGQKIAVFFRHAR